MLAILLSGAFLMVAPSMTNAQQSHVQHENIVYAETHGVGLVLDVFVPKGIKNGPNRIPSQRS